jgi:hypothetical protein
VNSLLCVAIIQHFLKYKASKQSLCENSYKAAVKKYSATPTVVQKHYNLTNNSKINQQQNQSKHEVKL